eukprot:10791008-Alexandrium_andersonii.AAC.1
MPQTSATNTPNWRLRGLNPTNRPSAPLSRAPKRQQSWTPPSAAQTRLASSLRALTPNRHHKYKNN